jgi:hypothetical protein
VLATVRNKIAPSQIGRIRPTKTVGEKPVAAMVFSPKQKAKKCVNMDGVRNSKHLKHAHTKLKVKAKDYRNAPDLLIICQIRTARQVAKKQ